MTQVISVVTAVHAPSIPYLREAYDSLASQQMPEGWTWEWLVHEDGPTKLATTVLPANDARVSISNGRQAGPAVARNMALSRATGSLVQVLDADDKLTDGALTRSVTALKDRTIGWTTSRVLDLLPDGSTTGWMHTDPAPGRIGRGEVLSYFASNNYLLPVHPATLCIRRTLALALGGWMALPGGEDTGLLLAASTVCNGYFIIEPGLLYRKHTEQITNTSDWREPTEWITRMRFIHARARALQECPD